VITESAAENNRCHPSPTPPRKGGALPPHEPTTLAIQQQVGWQSLPLWGRFRGGGIKGVVCKGENVR